MCHDDKKLLFRGRLNINNNGIINASPKEDVTFVRDSSIVKERISHPVGLCRCCRRTRCTRSHDKSTADPASRNSRTRERAWQPGFSSASSPALVD